MAIASYSELDVTVIDQNQEIMFYTENKARLSY